MAKDWNPGGFDGMDDEALRRFFQNAQSVVERKDPKLTERALALLPLIEAEFNRRNVSRPVPSPQNKRAPRSDKGRLERQYADAIVELVTMLSARYDLSAETAMRMSSGIPKFKPREPLGTTGDAIVGGARRSGKVAIDRYTAYRIMNHTILLSVVLEKNLSLDKIKFIVRAPRFLLKHPKLVVEIRTTANDETSLRNEEFGELFDNFYSAAEFYESLISQLAPRR